MNIGIKQVEGIATPCKPMLASLDLHPGSNLKNWALMCLNGNKTPPQGVPWGVGVVRHISKLPKLLHISSKLVKT